MLFGPVDYLSGPACFLLSQDDVGKTPMTPSRPNPLALLDPHRRRITAEAHAA
jgi:hypothetical protein